MAKSKKRNHKPKRNKPSGTVTAKSLRMSQLNLLMLMPYIINLRPYNGGKISSSLILNGITDRKYLTNDDLMTLEQEMYKPLDKLLRTAIASPHLDPALNAQIDDMDNPLSFYSKEAVAAREEFRNKCDVLDFTKYKPSQIDGDVFNDAFNRISGNPDPAYLWSTREYVAIKINESTEYAIKRGKYDKEDRTIEYEIREYDTTYVLDHIPIKAPSIIVKGKASILPISELSKVLSVVLLKQNQNSKQNTSNGAVDIHQTLCAIDNDIISSLKRDLLKSQPDEDHDWNEWYLPTFEIEEVLFGAHISAHCRKQISAADKSQQIGSYPPELSQIMLSKSISNLMLGLYRDDENITKTLDEKGDLAPGSFESAHYIAAYMLQKTMMALACIIVTNGLIMDKKMSRPVSVKKSSAKIYETVERTVEAKTTTTRKTRILDDSISISSTERPEAPTVEKIIRYTMSEWGRQGHLRHYKNGRVVEIKPVTVHRKCVDIGKTTKTNTDAGVDYIVKNKNTSN